MTRRARIERATKESKVLVEVDIDGTGRADVHTGVGFYDHMLDSFSRHSLIDLNVAAKGDLEVDAHHTVEDVGIVLGQAIEQALGDKRGIYRYGWAIVPMDESLAQVAIDLSGRPAFVFNVKFPRGTIGDFPVELVEEFGIPPAVRVGVPLDRDRPWNATDPVQLGSRAHVDQLGAGSHEGMRLRRQQGPCIRKVHLPATLRGRPPDLVRSRHGADYRLRWSARGWCVEPRVRTSPVRNCCARIARNPPTRHPTRGTDSADSRIRLGTRTHPLHVTHSGELRWI